MSAQVTELFLFFFYFLRRPSSLDAVDLEHPQPRQLVSEAVVPAVIVPPLLLENNLLGLHELRLQGGGRATKAMRRDGEKPWLGHPKSIEKRVAVVTLGRKGVREELTSTAATTEVLGT